MSDDSAQTGAPNAPSATGPVAVAAAKPRSIWLRFGSTVSASKWLLAATVVAGLLILFGLFLGGVAVFDWSESTAFCSLCHVMKPEYTAYQNSPHARIDCGTCHVGPGVLPAVQAKLASARYVWEYPTGNYPKPIPSPITSLRPVEVVCEQCHWPEKFYEDRLLTVPQYAQDEANSLTQIKLLLKTGGGPQNAGLGRGIHWHIENPVYYIATDKERQNIPWVQVTFNGKTTEYLSTDSKLTPQQIASAQKRKMDCVDCHNRATHIFQQPGEALDAALAAGTIPANLPFIKREGTKVLEKTYATETEAAKAIAAVEDFYRTQYPAVYTNRKADVQKAVAELQDIFNRTQFPFMKVTWETHPTNIGHTDFAGCFRCHDGNHLSNDNQAIRLECNICHSIPQVIVPGKTTAALPLTTGIEPDSHKSTTWLAEHRTRFDATCANCHTTGNAGGSDNSSFCSNSACHGTNWKFAGLNAPGVRQPSQPAQPAAGSGTVVATPLAGPTVTPTESGTAVATATPTAESGTAIATATPTASAGGTAPAIPHDLAGRDNCLTCHNPDGGIKPAPKDHAGRANDTCQGCHKLATLAGPTATPTAESQTAVATATPTASAGGTAPAIPHDLAGRGNCLTCHNPDGGVKPAPKDHVGRANDTCQACHKPAQ